MLCMLARSMRKVTASQALLGNGMRARKIAEGKCVKTMVLINPILLAKEDAARFDMEDMIFVTKKSVPSWPSGILNLRLKK